MIQLSVLSDGFLIYEEEYEMANAPIEKIDVKIGPAIVEYGTGEDKIILDITKGGIVFTATFTKQDVTVDQYGDTPVKSIIKGLTAQVAVPFALYDLNRINKVTPGSKLIEKDDKRKLNVYAKAGYDMLTNAKPLVIKPTDPDATEDDWITIPKAGPLPDLNYTYDSDNERITNVTFASYPNMAREGLAFVFGEDFDEDEGEGEGTQSSGAKVLSSATKKDDK